MSIRYAIESFAFIIRGKGRMSGQEYANEISKAYSIENPMTAEVVDMIHDHVEWIEVHYHGVAVAKTTNIIRL